jgi:hypothetical protein
VAYVTFSDFRTPTPEFAFGLDLTSTEAPDGPLAASIASISQRIDDLTNDHFESETLTLELNVESYSSRLYLPKRCRAITSINTRDEDGVLTLEPVTSYRLSSSLNTAGDYRLGDVDFLDIVGSGITGSLFYWPLGTRSVQVNGTFSWNVTPADIKRAVARLVYEHFKEQRPDVDRAETLTNAGVTLRFLETDDAHPTGIREVDQVIQRFYRWSKLAVG